MEAFVVVFLRLLNQALEADVATNLVAMMMEREESEEAGYSAPG